MNKEPINSFFSLDIEGESVVAMFSTLLKLRKKISSTFLCLLENSAITSLSLLEV